MRAKEADAVRGSLESALSVQHALDVIFFGAIWTLRYIHRRLRSSVGPCSLELFKQVHRACLRVNQPDCSLQTTKG